MSWIEQRRRADGGLTVRVFWRSGGRRDTPRVWETFGAGSDAQNLARADLTVSSCASTVFSLALAVMNVVVIDSWPSLAWMWGPEGCRLSGAAVDIHCGQFYGTTPSLATVSK